MLPCRGQNILGFSKCWGPEVPVNYIPSLPLLSWTVSSISLTFIYLLLSLLHGIQSCQSGEDEEEEEDKEKTFEVSFYENWRQSHPPKPKPPGRPSEAGADVNHGPHSHMCLEANTQVYVHEAHPLATVLLSVFQPNERSQAASLSANPPHSLGLLGNVALLPKYGSNRGQRRTNSEIQKWKLKATEALGWFLYPYSINVISHNSDFEAVWNTESPKMKPY